MYRAQITWLDCIPTHRLLTYSIGNWIPAMTMAMTPAPRAPEPQARSARRTRCGR